MISQKLCDAINAQINKEFASAYLYLGMAAHFDSLDLPGFSHWMIEQAKEEQEHAMKFYHFLLEVEGTAKLPAIAEVKTEYGTPKEVVAEILEHEKFVTQSINDLLALATEEKDYKTMSLLQWYVDEQVEEEASAREILGKLRYCEEGAGLLAIDRELGTRE